MSGYGPRVYGVLAGELQLAFRIVRGVDGLDLDPGLGLAPVGRCHGKMVRMNVRVRLFAGLRERAGWSEREIGDVATVGDVWGALGLGEEPSGLLYAVNREYAARDQALADGDEVALIPPVSGGAFRLSAEPLSLEAGRRGGRVRRSRRDRDVRRHDAHPLARPHRDAARVRGVRGNGGTGDGDDRGRAEGALRAVRDRRPPPHRPRRDRRAERRDRRERAAPSRRARRVQGRDRHAQGARPAVEKEVYEGGEEWIGRGS